MFPATPFVVAHRAGNDVSSARRAAIHGAGLVEADVRLHRGRLEVRHLKTLGPLPVLWDRWQLAGPATPRLRLRDLLARAGDLPLLLDLKGRDERIVPLLAADLDGRPTIVCSRSWRLLERLRDRHGTTIVHSVGSTRELRSLLDGSAYLEGVAVHERLLNETSAPRLRALTGTVLSWPVNTVERARELLGLGVDGLISDCPALIRDAIGDPPGAVAV